jgi:hypothetical protein
MARDESNNARAPTAWELTLAALQRNDSSVTKVYVHYYDDSIPHPNGQPLGVNLMLSSTVTDLVLEVPRQDLDGEPMTADDWALLLHYVATSAALCTVWLEHFDRNSPTATGISIFAEQIMRAARRNNSVRALKLCYHVAYDHSQMVEFLEQTTSLKEIQLDVSRRVLSDESRLIILEALAHNTQISDLILEFDDNENDDLDMFAHSLQMLHPSTMLQELHLTFWGNALLVPGDVWSSFLRDAKHLRCLSLFCMPFDRDAMKGLVKGLIDRDTAISLELDACWFFNGAIDELLCSIPTMRKHLVSTLTIRQLQDYDENYPRLYELFNDLIAKIYPLSPFQHLVLDLSCSFTLAVLGHLTIKAPPHMESLALVGYRIQAATTEALAAFVKSAIHLTKLSVQFSGRAQRLRTMLQEALRENGSIVDVGEGLPRTYCDRNANLRLLLQEQPNLSLVPSLFQAAKAAKKMAANMILAGLLGLND